MKYGTPVYVVLTHLHGQTRTVRKATIVGLTNAEGNRWRVKLPGGESVVVSENAIFENVEDAIKGA